MACYTAPEFEFPRESGARYRQYSTRSEREHQVTESAAANGKSLDNSESGEVKNPDALKMLLGSLPEKDLRNDYFEKERHENNGVVMKEMYEEMDGSKWRIKDRSKLSACGFVLCLNLGVDPPDITKPKECAKLECWFDPSGQNRQRANDVISTNLEKQYQSWYKNALYQYAVDPSVEKVQNMFLGLRRVISSNRLLFHYNGHGVPKPTDRGEIWVFNENLRKYIPLSMKELQTWVGKPSLYIFDASNSGVLLDHIGDYRVEPEVTRLSTTHFGRKNKPAFNTDVIVYCSCSVGETLPLTADLPADVFTSCITTPVKMALKWACLNSIFLKDIDPGLIDKIPGKQNDKSTPLGELNWIFTAITDTIAWSVLPMEVFRRLFRQDLLVAAISRNFLLACRILKNYGCTPCSHPRFPETHDHPLWQSWDLAAERIVCQLPKYAQDPKNYPIRSTTFFSEQLEGFKIFVTSPRRKRVKTDPQELPIILQILLNQEHRAKALTLISKFVDGGRRSVYQTLLVGLYPYINKMLLIRKADFGRPLIEIWAKCLVFDTNFQHDLVKDSAILFFNDTLLRCENIPLEELSKEDSNLITNVVLILTIVMSNSQGRAICYQREIISRISRYINSEYSELRKWVCLCWGRQFTDFQRLKSQEQKVVTTLEQVFSHDPDPEVRAAAVYVLGNFFERAERTFSTSDDMFNIGITLLVAMEDSSPLVRKEVVIAIGKLIRMYSGDFVQTVSSMIKTDSGEAGTDTPQNGESAISLSLCQCIWTSIVQQTTDPFYEIAQIVQSICSLIINRVPGNHSLTTIFEVTLNQSSSTPGVIPRSRAVKKKNKRKDEEKRRWGSGVDLPRVRSMDLSTLKTGDRKDTRRNSDEIGNDESDRTASDMSPDWESVLLQSSFFEYCIEKFNKSHSLDLARKRSRGPYFREAHEHSPKETRFLPFAVTERMARYGRAGITAQKLSNVVHHFQPHSLLTETTMTKNLKFHKLDPYLVSTDTNNNVRVYDYKEKKKINEFCGASTDVEASLVSAMEIINENTNPLLVVGSSEGIVRIWKNHTDSTQVEKLVTAFRVYNTGHKKLLGSGMIMKWVQHLGLLFVSGGGTNTVKIFDAEREMCVSNIACKSRPSCISVCNEETERIFSVGMYNGVINMFDSRSPDPFSLVGTFGGETTPVINMQLKSVGGTPTKIVSGYVQGGLNTWDIQNSQRISNIDMHGLSELSIHPFLPSVACTVNESNSILIYSTADDRFKYMTGVNFYDGLLPANAAIPSCMEYHPLKPYLALTKANYPINLYWGVKPKSKN